MYAYIKIKLFVIYIFFWKSIFHAFQISSRNKYNPKETFILASTKPQKPETSSKQDSLISPRYGESNFFHCLRPKRRALCPPISHPIPREDDSVAFQSSLGDEFANEPRPEWNRICEMGFLQSQMWPPS